MNNDNVTPETKSAGLSRRSVIKAGAWSVPVVALAVAAPLASASNVVPPVAAEWDTFGNGTSGGMSRAAGSATMHGNARAYYAIVPIGSGEIEVPTLTAVFTTSGAWGASPAFTVAPGTTATDGTNVGSLITVGGSNLQWVVSANNPGQLVLTSVSPTVAGSVSELSTPQIRVSGDGDGTGALAYLGVNLTGAPAANTTGATYDTASLAA